MKARLAAVLALPALAAGCGGDDDEPAKEPVRTQATTQAETSERPAKKDGERRRTKRQSKERETTRTAPVPKPPPIDLPVQIFRGRIIPPIVTVPPLQRVKLVVGTVDARSHTVELRAPGGGTVTVSRGERRVLRIPPKLRRGSYRLLVDGGRTKATLRVIR